MTSLLLAAMLFLQAPVIKGNGIVTGRVLSIEGMPASGVRVTAMTPREPGQAEGVAIHTSITQTDSSGRYRLEDIPPGRYYITAGLIDVPTYYPGVSALSDAKVVVIVDRATTEGVDFQLKVPPGMKVSGRLAVVPTPRAIPETLTLGGGTTPTQRETNLNPDGTFEFLRVTPGRYTLTNYLGLPNLPVVVTDHDVTGLEVGGSITGVRIKGRIVSPDSSPATLTSLRILLSGTFNQARSTTVQGRPDGAGAFEFLQVPPGRYQIRVPVTGAKEVLFVVSDKEITNLEVPVPFQREVSGRVVLEDGRPWTPVPAGVIEARLANSITIAGIDGGGSFTLRLSEGEYQIGLRGFPMGYVLKGVSIDGKPLTGLKVSPGTPASASLVVTLASLPLESVQGVKVTGRITGVPPGGLSSARVFLSGDPGTTIEATPNPDGTFEFSRVPPGNYNTRVNGIAYAYASVYPTRVLVAIENITGVQIPVEVRTMVNGRVTLVDANGTVLPGFPVPVSVSFRGHSSSAGARLRPEGTFGLLLTEGEYTVSFDPLPAGYTVKSAVSGSLELLKNPLKVDKGVTPPLIEVQLEAKP